MEHNDLPISHIVEKKRRKKQSLYSEVCPCGEHTLGFNYQGRVLTVNMVRTRKNGSIGKVIFIAADDAPLCSSCIRQALKYCVDPLFGEENNV